MDRKTKYFETILKIKAKDMLEKCDQEEFDARSNKSDSAPRSKKLRSRRNNNSDA